MNDRVERTWSQQPGRAMMIVGLIGVLAALVWLLLVEEPFPMWLIIAGGGLVFLGAGAALDRNAT